jgi:hypothetical protein
VANVAVAHHREVSLGARHDPSPPRAPDPGRQQSTLTMANV